MGYTRHDAIVVTGCGADSVADAHAFAVELGCSVSGIVEGVVNGYQSFLIAPDGSKEGWQESDKGDEQREKFIAWLKEKRKAHVWLDWIAVNYGGDNSHEARITDHHGLDAADEE